MGQEVEIFKALDFLMCRPDEPEYEDLFDKNGFCYGRKMTNIIKICNCDSFVTAIQDPDRNYAMLVFGKYPVYKFLLKPIGKIIIK